METFLSWPVGDVNIIGTIWAWFMGQDPLDKTVLVQAALKKRPGPIKHQQLKPPSYHPYIYIYISLGSQKGILFSEAPISVYIGLLSGMTESFRVLSLRFGD